jgi:lipopolysaccharide export system protein LptC
MRGDPAVRDDGRRMALGDNAYSRLVAWLKILLPLAALVMLSVLFLLSRQSDPTDIPRWIEGRPSDLTTGEQVTRPSYAGLTEDGTDLTVTARRARPEPGAESRALAEELVATARLPDGSEVRLAARAGLLDEAAGEALLSGGVEIESSTGYRMQSERFRVDLDRLSMDSLGPVTGRGPAGRLSAGRMQVSGATEETGARLLFTEGVKLLYDPQG